MSDSIRPKYSVGQTIVIEQYNYRDTIIRFFRISRVTPAGNYFASELKAERSEAAPIGYYVVPRDEVLAANIPIKWYKSIKQYSYENPRGCLFRSEVYDPDEQYNDIYGG